MGVPSLSVRSWGVLFVTSGDALDSWREYKTRPGWGYKGAALRSDSDKHTAPLDPQCPPEFLVTLCARRFKTHGG